MCHINYIKKMYRREATLICMEKQISEGIESRQIGTRGPRRLELACSSLQQCLCVFMYVWVVASDTLVTVIDIACSITVPVV